MEGYGPTLGTQCYDTVSGVVAYDHPQTGEVLHLVLNQAIHIPHLDHHLLCQMQCHVNVVTVGETPKFLVPNPIDKAHAGQLTLEEKSREKVREFLIFLLWNYYKS